MATLIDWALETELARRRQAIEGAKFLQATALIVMAVWTLAKGL